MVDKLVVLGALGFAVGDESFAEVGIDDLDFLDVGEGGVVDGFQFHVQFEARGDVLHVAEATFGSLGFDGFLAIVGIIVVFVGFGHFGKD